MARRRRCTWCGELISGDAMPHRDAADHKHWFHAACWVKHCRWMSGPRRKGGE